MPIVPAQNVVIANRFRLNRMIGRGGMGSVWQATHLGLDVPCAVKFIEGEGSALPEIHARFEREAKAAAQLRSPHVVQILDHGVCEGTPYIAMELLDGEDLGKRLTRLGRLPPHELIGVVTQVCRALTKAHAQGIVHRDLKPDNIFLVRDDDREIAKVLDFGIAKSGVAGGVGGSNTRTGAMLGTPYYMSPEQAQGTRAVDFRSDLWSLGVIVFEAMVGSRPFESEALGDLLMKIIVGPIPMPSQVARDMPPGLDAWWARASQRDPALRFQSAKELCDSLAMAFGRSGSDIGERGSRFGTTPMGAMTPPILAVTPQPVHATTQQAPQMGVSTGAPIAQTYGTGPQPAKGRTGFFVAIAAAAVVVVAAGVAGVSYAVRDKGPAAAAGPVDGTTGSTTAVLHGAPAQPAPPSSVAAVLAKLPEPPAAAPSASAPVHAATAEEEARPEPPPPATVSAPAPLHARPAVVQPPQQRPSVHGAPSQPPGSASRPPEEKKPIDLGI
jgi:serine/threonine-protein kinase